MSSWIQSTAQTREKKEKSVRLEMKDDEKKGFNGVAVKVEKDFRLNFNIKFKVRTFYPNL